MKYSFKSFLEPQIFNKKDDYKSHPISEVTIPDLNLSFRSDQIVSIIGGPGEGKSSLVQGIGAILIQNGKKVFHLDFENDSRFVVAGYLAPLLESTKRDALNPNFNQDKKDRLVELYDDRLFMEGVSEKLTVSKIIDTIESTRKEFNLDVVIIDCFSQLFGGLDMNKEMTELSEYSKNAGVGIIVTVCKNRNGSNPLIWLNRKNPRPIYIVISEVDLNNIISQVHIDGKKLRLNFDISSNLFRD